MVSTIFPDVTSRKIHKVEYTDANEYRNLHCMLLGKLNINVLPKDLPDQRVTLIHGMYIYNKNHSGRPTGTPSLDNSLLRFTTFAYYNTKLF